MSDYLISPGDFNDPKVASTFDEMSYWASKFAGLIFNNLELLPNIEALDLACGTGCPLFELAQMHGESSRFTGADIADAMLARAAAKQAVYQVPNVKLVKMEGDTFPFNDAQFDLITCNLGINNFDKPETVLGECRRVAKTGGRLVLTTNVKGHMREFYDVYRDVLNDFGKPEYLAKLAANEDHRGTKESVARLVENAGFEVRRVIEDSFVLRYLNGSAFLKHWFIRLGFIDGWRGVVEASDERAVFSMLEARLNALATEYGELRLTIPMLYVEGVKKGS